MKCQDPEVSSGSCIPSLGQWGRCKEMIGDEIQLMTENQNVYILRDAKRGTANPGTRCDVSGPG